jgi:hypothetical protein
VNALPFMLKTPREGAGWLMSNLLSTRLEYASHECMLHGTVIGGSADERPKRGLSALFRQRKKKAT